MNQMCMHIRQGLRSEWHWVWMGESCTVSQYLLQSEAVSLTLNWEEKVDKKVKKPIFFQIF